MNPMGHRPHRSRFFPAGGLLIALLAMPPGPASGQGLSSVKTVFIILFENTDWASITPSAAPYIRNTLVPMGAHAEQYFTPPGNHPSEPNYVWLEAGSNLGLSTDNDASASNSTNTVDHLVRYLEDAGISWKTYQEDIDGLSCPLTSFGNYAAKHNPFVFFQDITDNESSGSAHCIAHNRPYTELATDLQNGTVARYNFITPNLCNDMHDCSVTTGDTWLSQNLPKILASQAYKENGAVFITWDEGVNNSDGPIGMIVLSSLAKVNYSNSIPYTHSSTLRTMQEIFGVGPPVHPFLRDAANVMDLGDLFNITNPAPMLSSLAPSSASAGGAGLTLTVTGSNFVASSVVLWNGASRPVTFVSNTQLQAAISAADIVTAGTAHVTVVTPAPGGGTSNGLTFTIVSAFPLAVVRAGSGSGTVTSTPAGITCGATCSASFASGTSVLLTVAPMAGSLFIGWSGGACGGIGTCTVNVTARTTVTANFSNQTVLTMSKAGTGSGTVTSNPAGITCGGACTSAFTTGTAVILTATADSGSTFAGWSGGCAGAGTCILTLGSESAVTATFTANTVDSFALSVAQRGSASGTISSNPGGVLCGRACAAIYPSSRSVTLTAVPGAGASFKQWEGSCGGSGGCAVTMAAAQSVAAVFSVVYTDRSLAAATVAKAAHLVELRAAVNTLRTQSFGLPAYSFTDLMLSAGTTSIRAVHITELRTALNDAYTAAGLLSPSYTDPTLTAGTTTIKAVHITELRVAIQALE